MFGTIVTNPKALSKEENDRYAACYCGLCHQLDARFGNAGSAVLAYDMTFLSMLLGALYQLPETGGSRRCAVHPFKARPYVITEAASYAADMNVALAYYQRMDDWNDDHNLAAREQARKLESFLPDIEARYPEQWAAISDAMARLGEMERGNELNPDLPTNCFGELMAALFLWRRDEHTPALYRMGAALGRYVYLLDAVNDLREDLKKQHYNPLVAQMNTDFVPILTMMMAECTEAFETLPIERDAHILQNVLYSGVWQKYRLRKREGTEDADG